MKEREEKGGREREMEGGRERGREERRRIFSMPNIGVKSEYQYLPISTKPNEMQIMGFKTFDLYLIIA
jgi:hypothetical protein